jgi:Transcriptional regulator, AbiEi antitoxin
MFLSLITGGEIMGTDLKRAVIRSIDKLKKAISVKSSEIARLENELKCHETVLELLGSNGRGKVRVGSGARRSATNLREVLARLPDQFTSQDFVKAAVRTKKPSVYLRQTLSRWARQGKIKRVERGKYHKVRNGGMHRMAA